MGLAGSGIHGGCVFHLWFLVPSLQVQCFDAQLNQGVLGPSLLVLNAFTSSSGLLCSVGSRGDQGVLRSSLMVVGASMPRYFGGKKCFLLL